MTTPKPVSPVEQADSAREVIARAVIALPFETRWEVADAVLAEFQSAGYAVVPVEPTEAMALQGWLQLPRLHPRLTTEVAASVYRAMLLAAEEKNDARK